MDRYERKKLYHTPILLIICAAYLALQLTMLLLWASAYRFDAYDCIMDEMYKGMELPDIIDRIGYDANEAEAALHENMPARYESGEISIEELRAWKDGEYGRYEKDSVMQQLQARVEELGKLLEIYQLAQAKTPQNTVSPEESKWIARWSPIRLIHEKGWEAIYRLEKVTLIGYIVILLTAFVYTEAWDTRMAVHIRMSERGWRQTEKAKGRFVWDILLGLCAVECILEYAVPFLMLGRMETGAAIQSVKIYEDVTLPFSLGGYLAFCCLVKVIGAAFLAQVVRLLSALVRSTYAVLGISVAVFMLGQALDIGKGTADKLLTPSRLLVINTEPERLLVIIACYAVGGALIGIAYSFIQRRMER